MSGLKHTTGSILSGIALLLLWSSCSSHLSIQKRRYLKGHYFSFLHKTPNHSKPVEQTAVNRDTQTKGTLTTLVKNQNYDTPDFLKKTPPSTSISQVTKTNTALPVTYIPNQNPTLKVANEAMAESKIKTQTPLKFRQLTHKKAGFLKILAGITLLAFVAALLVLAFLLAILDALGGAGAAFLALLCLIGAVVFFILALRLLF